MSLQFIFGNSGSGKSDYLYNFILEQAAAYPDKNFLVLVPEQYTMQTQREFVMRQPNHAIMNVDVLSFARLAYRVFDELGMQNLVVLEETGKNLVMRKVAELHRGELPVLGGNMNKMGYVDEVKSLISEMVQYNISPDDLETFLAKENIGEALRLKMQDVLTLYRGFEDYMQGKFITSEEVLSLLCEVAPKSELIRGAVLVFDEFTGFTPIQNRLLRVLFPMVEKVMVSVSIDSREDFYHSRGTHELFAMSKKTVDVLLKMAGELHIPVEDAVVMEPGEKKRYAKAPDLFFLEQNLFRPKRNIWENTPEHIRLLSQRDPREELTFVAREITRLIREKGYSYKDIAVVTGDVPSYANYVPEIFEQYDIPHFIDETRNILFHPLTEFLRAALEVVEYDFSYESIFRFLRCGLFPCDTDEIDRLENYVLAKGIRGRKKWEKDWNFVLLDGSRQEMPEMNGLRGRIAAAFAPLFEVFDGSHSVEEQTLVLYQFLVELSIEQQMKQKEAECEEAGELAKAKEYAQIYRIVMDLLDKVVSLLGEEQIPIREYSDILDAGFSAAKVGVIPPGNDKVTIGDIERTRLNHIKVLFFVGVNDGVVPKNSGGGGIISQFEREKMTEHHLELAPGMRERVFIQKFYLYLNMTKPSNALYLSFSRVGSDGKALRPSYLIEVIRHLFTGLKVEETENEASRFEQEIFTPENGVNFFVEGLQKKEFSEEWAALASWYFNHDDYRERMQRLVSAAYERHTDEPISRAVTRALYGTELENSVTRLERFAACAFAHYLSYGLKLQERELQQFASVDMGNIYHDALEHFAKRVEDSEYTWFHLPEEIQEKWIEESMEDAVLACHNAGAFEEAKNRYLLSRMKNTMRRTVWALVRQIQKGKFVPSDFEVSFSRADHLDSIQFRLSEEEKMRLQGRIDRVDTYETEDKVYVKIIDYKSGNTTFSLLNLYHGLQLQLVVYLNAAVELTAKKHPDKAVEPAGIFYYHIDDPMVEGNGRESETEIREAVFEQLKLNGLVNEETQVYRAMDEDFAGSSSVIPVAEKADGSLTAASKTASAEDFAVMSEYVNGLVKETGKRILAGDVAVSPYQLDDKNGCKYCPYHAVCGFDTRIAGYEYRSLEKISETETILEKMKEGTVGEDGSIMDQRAAAGH
jgi:ATP-dependent helicase/nuclease subunit B